MSIAQLLADLACVGIRLQADGDRLRFAPRSAVTPDLAQRMKDHKAELLALLGDPSTVDVTDASAVWKAALDQLKGHPLFPPNTIEHLRAADAEWRSDVCETLKKPSETEIVSIVDTNDVELRPDGWPVDTVDPGNLTPCPQCGSLEQWQSVASDPFGHSPGTWRCMHCEPATNFHQKAELLREIANTRKRRKSKP